MDRTLTAFLRVLAVPALAGILVACQTAGEDDADPAVAGTPSDTLPVDSAAPSTAGGDSSGSIVIENVGFQTPESVLHDEIADVYLVSNINGQGGEHDDNGFISRIGADGKLLDLKFIDGAEGAVRLSAPKGTALRGDSLYVADLDTIRVFHRETGEPIGAIGVPGASFLNDLATGPDGTLYATDTGVRFGPDGPEQTGTAAVYRFDGGRPVAITKGDQLGNPNGIAVDANGPVVVTMGSGKILRIASDGAVTEFATPPTGQLDGVVILDDGGMLVTSWEGKTTYHVTPTGEFHDIWPNFESPADLGYDRGRSRMLMPSFMGNRVELATTH